MSKGSHTDLLRQFGLSRNPFVDRTAEKTSLDPVSLYVVGGVLDHLLLVRTMKVLPEDDSNAVG